MNIELKTTTAIIGPMTAAERQRGRYMRAPDGHGDGGDSGGGGDSSGGDDSASGGESGDDGLSTEARLAKEFGEQSSDDGDGGANEDDEGQEDLGSDGSEDDEGDGSDGEDEGGEGDDDADGQDEDGKPKNRTEERIAEFQNATREAERKAAEATREAEKWRRIAESAPQAPEASGEGESDPNAEPDPADFEFGAADPEYIAAKAEFRALARLRQEGADAAFKAELNGLEAKYQGGVPAAMEKYPDYDTVVTKGAEGENPAWVCPPIIALGIRSSDVGHDVAYHLAKNPTEASRIAKLNNYDQVREFGRLEGRFMYEAEQKKAKNDDKGGGNGAPPPKKRSSAPTPPAKNLARGAGGKFSVPPDTNDFAAFDKTYGNGPKKR